MGEFNKKMDEMSITQKLVFENDLFRQLLTFSDTHLVCLDRNFNIVYANKAYIQGTGYSESKLFSCNYFELFPDEENRKIFHQVRDHGDPVEFRAKQFKYNSQPENNTAYWDWMLTPVKDDNCVVIGLILSLTDVTFRIRAELDMIQSNERYRQLFENSLHGIAFHEIVIDKAGKPIDYIFLDVNNAFESLTGLKRDSIIGKSVSEVLPGIEQDPAEWIARYGQVALKGEPIRFEQYSQPLNKWYYVSAFSPKKMQFCTLFDDITSYKQIEAQLRQRASELAEANHELDAFSYSVAHDLRSPLKVINGFCSFLLEDYSNQLDGDGIDYINKIQSGVEKMKKIIDDMLVLSKISQQEIELSEVDLSLVAQMLLDDLRSNQLHRAIEVHVHENLKIAADHRLVRIALRNLLANAIKYTCKSKQACIEFGCNKEDAKLVFYVKDNGIGFDMKHADKLFIPFKRLHSETDFPGTGVGLTIVERIIRRHGGRIWAESEPGKGATFYFTLKS